MFLRKEKIELVPSTTVIFLVLPLPRWCARPHSARIRTCGRLPMRPSGPLPRCTTTDCRRTCSPFSSWPWRRSKRIRRTWRSMQWNSGAVSAMKRCEFYCNYLGFCICETERVWNMSNFLFWRCLRCCGNTYRPKVTVLDVSLSTCEVWRFL